MKWPTIPTLMVGAVAGIGAFAVARMVKAKGNAPQTTAPAAPAVIGKPTGFFAKDGKSINIGSVIEVDALSLTNDEILSIPVLGSLKRGDLVAREHIDDTLVFKVSPEQSFMLAGFINAVLFDSRIGFKADASAAFKDLATTMGNAIPAAKVLKVLPGT